jgi:hypothetical protein
LVGPAIEFLLQAVVGRRRFFVGHKSTLVSTMIVTVLNDSCEDDFLENDHRQIPEHGA